MPEAFMLVDGEDELSEEDSNTEHLTHGNLASEP